MQLLDLARGANTVLNVNQNTKLDVTLQEGAATQVVEVTGDVKRCAENRSFRIRACLQAYRKAEMSSALAAAD